jgi:DNA polymerase III alpha subunit (gram-positive type)
MMYTWFDTETSGTNPKIHSVLTAYFAIYDESLNFVDEIELFLKPDSGEVIAEEQALKVNGINLEEHLKNPRTVTYSVGKEMILDFFSKHKSKGRNRLRPSGHNIEFDKGFIMSQIMTEEEWSKYIHHNSIDTLRIVTFLQDIGMVPNDVGRLTDLVEHFGITKRDAHDAREDVKMNIEVYKKMKEMLTETKNNVALVSGSDLLKIVEL